MSVFSKLLRAGEGKRMKELAALVDLGRDGLELVDGEFTHHVADHFLVLGECEVHVVRSLPKRATS